MMRQYIVGILFFIITATGLRGQSVVPVVAFDALQPLLSLDNDTVYVVNFWATWCKPCIEEMPYFAKAAEKLAEQKVQFVMVSLDLPRKIDQSLYPYLAKNKVPGQVILLNDADANTWIPKVDKNWDGAIPVTLFYKGKDRIFINESFDSVKDILAVINKLNK